jgi:hypothetical protein
MGNSLKEITMYIVIDGLSPSKWEICYQENEKNRIYDDQHNNLPYRKDKKK